MKKCLVLAMVLVVDLAMAEGVVGNVALRQIEPWNGLVEIGYELTESVVVPEGRFLDTEVVVRDSEHGTNYAAKTFTTMPDYSAGRHRLVWNARADGVAFASTNAVAAVSVVSRPAKYCVIDLSGGVDAVSYPVSYLADVPKGGWTDEHKTEKLVLRKIEPGTFMMGSPDDEIGRALYDENLHQVTLTKGFWIGVFEVTQKQFELVMEENPSDASADMHPVESVSLDLITDDGGFLGVVASKSGLTCSLPTEAQWEYACRAGTTTALNSGKNLTSVENDPNMDEVGCYFNNAFGDGGCPHDEVGSYLPNAWGLYDMHGNVWEWCQDYYGDYATGSVTDPIGADSDEEGQVMRGGSWMYPAAACRSATRGSADPFYGAETDVGFRLCCAEQLSLVGGTEVLGTTESAAASIALNRSTTWVMEQPASFRVDYGTDLFSATDGAVQVLVNGEVWQGGSDFRSVDWTPPNPGLYELTVRSTAGEERYSVSCEIWSRSLTVDDCSTPLKERFPTTYGSIVSVTVAEGVQTIGAGFFADCASLESVTLPSEITAVEAAAFDGCANLATVSVPRLEDWLSIAFADDVDDVVLNGTALLVDGQLWTPNDFSVAYEANGGFFPEDQVVTSVVGQVCYATYVLPPSNPIRNGYAFKGYWTEASGGTEVTGRTIAKACEDLVFHAHWGPLDEATAATVRFNATGGVVDPTEWVFARGDACRVLPEPTRDGYGFGGWFSGDEAVTIRTILMGDLVVDARWLGNPYSVVYHANGGTGEMAQQALTYGSPTQLSSNAFVWAGHAFAGWATNEVGEVVYGNGEAVSNLTAVAGGVVDLYARWRIVECAIAYENVRGVENPNPAFYTSGDHVEFMALPSLPGIRFVGWSPAFIGRESTGEVVVSALWEAFDLGDFFAGDHVVKTQSGGNATWDGEWDGRRWILGSGVIEKSQECWFELTVTNTTRVVFDWRTSCEEPEEEEMFDGVTLYVDGEPVDALCGESGWVTNVVHETVGDGEHVLRWVYAKDRRVDAGEDRAWIANVRVLSGAKISFDGNGNGAGTPPAACLVFEGDAFRLPDAGGMRKSYHVFQGWQIGDEVFEADDDLPIPAKDVTCRAVWKVSDEVPRDKFVVLFERGGGTGTMMEILVTPDTVVNLPHCTFALPEGKTRFRDWACSNGRCYDDGMLVFNLAEPGELVTMTAMWE